VLTSGCNAGEEIIPSGETGGSAGTGTMTAGGTGTMTTGGTGTMTTGGSGTSGGSGMTGGMGGTGGAAGSGGTGGSGGAAGEDLMAVVQGWNGWRFEMDCISYPGGAPLDASCSQNDICWVGTDATQPHKETKAIVMGGDPAKVYEFELWARGVIEPKVHTNCEKLFTEVEPGSGIRVCKGGEDGGSNFNIWRIDITDPPQHYWMNNADNDTHRTNILNGKFKVQARGQTTVMFTFDNKNTGQIRNGCPAFQKTVEGVPPYPAFHDGNFFQLDVTPDSVKVVE
jgi:hypothetical protein